MKKQIFRTADQKEFIGLFDGLCMRRHAWQAWGDFVEACAIAEIQMGDAQERIQTRGWVSINDCACGAGALLIAARNVMMRAGQDWSSQALFVAQDIDRTAALMCYLQLSLLGCAGYVVIADSLRYPITGSLLRPTPVPEQDIWYTPTLYLSPVWGYRMLWERIESVQRYATSDPEPEIMTDVGTQLTLF